MKYLSDTQVIRTSIISLNFVSIINIFIAYNVYLYIYVSIHIYLIYNYIYLYI